MQYISCNGKCTFEGTRCEGCGRSHEETHAMNGPMDQLVGFAQLMDYENLEDFVEGIAGGLRYKLGLLEH